MRDKWSQNDVFFWLKVPYLPGAHPGLTVVLYALRPASGGVQSMPLDENASPPASLYQSG